METDPVSGRRLGRAISAAAGLALAAGCLSVPDVIEFAQFPPQGMDVDIYFGAIAADVNDDGADDLILSNLPANVDDRGVFVLLGPIDGDQAAFHAFIPTGADRGLSPRAIAAEDVLGSDGIERELLIAGEDQNGNMVVEIYPFVGDEDSSQLYAREPAVTLSPGFEVINPDAPISLAVGDVDGDGVDADVVVADLFELRVLRVPDPGDTGAEVEPMGGGTWPNIQSLQLRQRRDQLVDDLIVVTGDGVHWVENDGEGTLADEVFTLGDEQYFGGAYADIDQGSDPGCQLPGGFKGEDCGRLDAFAMAASGIGGFLVNDSSTPSIRPIQVFLDPTLAVELDGIIATDFTFDGVPDVVLLNSADSSTPALFSLDNIAIVQDDHLEGTRVQQIDFEAFDPRTMALGDFAGDDGDVTVLVVARDGELRCFRHSTEPGDGLIPCAQ